MEVDNSMHSAIEKAQKYVPIYTVHDWMTICRMARTKRSGKKPYIVRELKFTDFLDLAKLSKTIMKNKLKNTLGEKVNWLKVKCFKYSKCKPCILLYRYDHFSDIRNVLRKGRPINFKRMKIGKAYTKLRSISVQKHQDLLKLCKTEVIPEDFHWYYKSLPTTTNVTETIPEPAADDSDHTEISDDTSSDS